MSEESGLQKLCVELARVMLKPRRGTVFVIPNNRHSRRVAGFRAGAPDLGIILDSRIYGVELKARKGVVADHQSDVHAEWRAAGATVFVARSISEFEGVLKALVCGRQAA